MVNIKLIFGAALLIGIALVLSQTEFGKKAVSEAKKLGSDVKSTTKKVIDKVDKKGSAKTV